VWLWCGCRFLGLGIGGGVGVAWGTDRPRMPAEWHRTRRRVLRDCPVCYVCQQRPSVAVDHVVPRWRGGGEDTLAGICVECHAVKSAAEGHAARAELRRRRRRPSGRHPGAL
jgi:5-methylcytosine-specific restriction endonuclease McrA